MHFYSRYVVLMLIQMPAKLELSLKVSNTLDVGKADGDPSKIGFIYLQHNCYSLFGQV
jgi:hypothetical protein